MPQPPQSAVDTAPVSTVEDEVLAERERNKTEILAKLPDLFPRLTGYQLEELLAHIKSLETGADEREISTFGSIQNPKNQAER